MDHHPISALINQGPQPTHTINYQPDQLQSINVPRSIINRSTNRRSQLLLDTATSICQHIILDWIVCAFTTPPCLQCAKSYVWV
jgi:hypothetical protein